jgi:uncharacterized protein YjlB
MNHDQTGRLLIAGQRDIHSMPASTELIEPLTFMFADDGVIPNNPYLPLLVYRRAINLAGTPDPERAIEEIFARNAWGDMWRNGIYPFTHYHSMIHEVLGIARGRARVRFGGNHGTEIEVAAGDVAVLPAGTGHQRAEQSPDLVVIGAYPPAGTYNLCRGTPREHGRARAAIPHVPLPAGDPVFGPQGPLTRLWRA